MNMTYQGNDKMDHSCTATSVYLSFDEETSPIYKTLTSISDNSMIDVDLDANRESENENYHQESTLEADKALPMLSMLETVQDNSQPLKPLTNTNILQDFNVLLSSTPSKENLNMNYELPHGLNNNIQVDLHLAFANIDDDQSKNFETNSAALLSHLIGENKENISPEGKKAGNLSNSSSSSNTITPLKEQQIQPEEYLSDKSNTISSPQDNDRKLTKNSVPIKTSYKFTDIKTITSLIEQHNTNESQQNLPTVSSKTIEISKTLSSETEIPQLMDEILQISNKTSTKDKQTTISSTCTTIVGEKRPLNPTARRRSAVLRTTLNTSSNKMTRKSMAISTISQSRRSMIPQNINIKLNKAKVPQKNSVFCKSNENETPHHVKEQNDKKVALLNNNKNFADVKAVKAVNLDKLRKSVGSNLATARFIKPETTYSCMICKAKFRIKSLLDAHKLSHDYDMPEQNPAKRRIDNSNSNSNSNSNTNSNPNSMPNSLAAITLSAGSQCKYCDKKFALQRTLHIHLLENCQKIPPSDKRKLQFTENNHVVKAQLPNVFNSQQNSSSNSNSNSSSNSSSNNAFFMAKKSNTKPSTRTKDSGKTLQQMNSMGELTKSTSSLAQIKAICKSVESSQMMNGMMLNNCEQPPPPPPPLAPPTGLPKIKKTIAHSGVYCTPTKTIPCHLCKLSFKTILDFTNHNLMCHMITTTTTAACQP